MNAGDATAANAKSSVLLTEWKITLPIHVRDNDSRLQIAARNLLRLPGVRSVTIDGGRTQAVVKLRPQPSRAIDVADFPGSVFHDPPADTAGDLHSSSLVSWVDGRDQSWCFIALPENARGLKRVLLFAAAGLALALGLLGVLLPGLPTTPFVLVASYCLLRCSPRMHAQLLHSKLFGGVLRDWHLHRGLRSHVRYKATAVILLVLAASLLLSAIPIPGKVAILVVATAGVCYVWRLPAVVD